MISLILIHENFPVAPIGGPAQQPVITNKPEKPQPNAMQQVAEKYNQIVQPGGCPQQFSPYMYLQQNPMMGYGATFAAPAIASSLQQQNSAKKAQKPTQPKDVEITTSEFLKKKLDKKPQLAKKKLNSTMEFLKPFGLGAATALTAQALKQQYDNLQQGA